jgi:hypothetical protein
MKLMQGDDNQQRPQPTPAPAPRMGGSPYQPPQLRTFGR